MAVETIKYDGLLVTVNGSVCVATFDRPKSLNSWRSEEFSNLIDVLRRTAADERIIITVITGNGRYFSSGADLRSGGAGKLTTREQYNDYFDAHTKGLTLAMIDYPKILIAALNGPVVGLPAALLPLFDVVYAAESTTLALPFTSLGISSEGAASFTFPLSTGLSNTGDALLLSRVQTSHDLLVKGIVSKVFPDATFRDEVMKIAESASKLPHNSLLANKKLIRGHFRAQLKKANNDEGESLIDRFLSGEPQKIFESFAKRDASFKKAKL